jgi:hypothetical protein
MGDWTKIAEVIGGGGVLTLLILRQVLPYLRNRHTNRNENRSRLKIEATAGDKTVDFWENTLEKTISNVVAAVVVPVLSNQTSILSAQTILLDKLRSAQEDAAKSLAILIDRVPRSAG